MDSSTPRHSCSAQLALIALLLFAAPIFSNVSAQPADRTGNQRGNLQPSAQTTKENCYPLYDYAQHSEELCTITLSEAPTCKTCPEEVEEGTCPASPPIDPACEDCFPGNERLLGAEAEYQKAVEKLSPADKALLGNITPDEEGSLFGNATTYPATGIGTTITTDQISNDNYTPILYEPTCSDRTICDDITDFAHAAYLKALHQLHSSMFGKGASVDDKIREMQSLVALVAGKFLEAQAAGCEGAATYTSSIGEQIGDLQKVLENSKTVDDDAQQVNYIDKDPETGDTKIKRVIKDKEGNTVLECIGFSDHKGNFHPEICTQTATGKEIRYYYRSEAQLREECLADRAGFVQTSYDDVIKKLEEDGCTYLWSLIRRLDDDRAANPKKYAELVTIYNSPTHGMDPRLARQVTKINKDIDERLSAKLQEQGCFSQQAMGRLREWLTLMKAAEIIAARCTTSYYRYNYMYSDIPKVRTYTSEDGSLVTGVNLSGLCEKISQCREATNGPRMEGLSASSCHELRRWMNQISNDLLQAAGPGATAQIESFSPELLSDVLYRWIKDVTLGVHYEGDEATTGTLRFCQSNKAEMHLSFDASTGVFVIQGANEDNQLSQVSAQFKEGHRGEAVLASSSTLILEDSQSEPEEIRRGMEYLVSDGGRTSWRMFISGNLPYTRKYRDYIAIDVERPINFSEDVKHYFKDELWLLGKGYGLAVGTYERTLGIPINVAVHGSGTAWYSAKSLISEIDYGMEIAYDIPLSPEEIKRLSPEEYKRWKRIQDARAWADAQLLVNAVANRTKRAYEYYKMWDAINPWCNDKQVMKWMNNFFIEQMIPLLGEKGLELVWSQLKKSELEVQEEKLGCHKKAARSKKWKDCLALARQGVAAKHNGDLSSPDIPAIVKYLAKKDYAADQIFTYGASLEQEQWAAKAAYAVGGGLTLAGREAATIATIVGGLRVVKAISEFEKFHRFVRGTAHGAHLSTSAALLASWAPEWVKAHFKAGLAFKEGNYLEAAHQLEPIFMGWAIIAGAAAESAKRNDRCRRIEESEPNEGGEKPTEVEETGEWLNYEKSGSGRHRIHHVDFNTNPEAIGTLAILAEKAGTPAIFMRAKKGIKNPNKSNPSHWEIMGESEVQQAIKAANEGLRKHLGQTEPIQQKATIPCPETTDFKPGREPTGRAQKPTPRTPEKPIEPNGVERLPDETYNKEVRNAFKQLIEQIEAINRKIEAEFKDALISSDDDREDEDEEPELKQRRVSQLYMERLSNEIDILVREALVKHGDFIRHAYRIEPEKEHGQYPDGYGIRKNIVGAGEQLSKGVAYQLIDAKERFVLPIQSPVYMPEGSAKLVHGVNEGIQTTTPQLTTGKTYNISDDPNIMAYYQWKLRTWNFENPLVLDIVPAQSVEGTKLLSFHTHGEEDRTLISEKANPDGTVSVILAPNSLSGLLIQSSPGNVVEDLKGTASTTKTTEWLNDFKTTQALATLKEEKIKQLQEQIGYSDNGEVRTEHEALHRELIQTKEEMQQQWQATQQKMINEIMGEQETAALGVEGSNVLMLFGDGKSILYGDHLHSDPSVEHPANGSLNPTGKKAAQFDLSFFIHPSFFEMGRGITPQPIEPGTSVTLPLQLPKEGKSAVPLLISDPNGVVQVEKVPAGLDGHPKRKVNIPNDPSIQIMLLDEMTNVMLFNTPSCDQEATGPGTSGRLDGFPQRQPLSLLPNRGSINRDRNLNRWRGSQSRGPNGINRTPQSRDLANAVAQERALKTSGNWQEAMHIALHPVPANQWLYVTGIEDHPDALLIVTDGYGKRLINTTASELPNKQIDVNSWTPGLYQLMVSDPSGQTVTKRFCVVR